MMSFEQFYFELQQCLCKKCGAPRNELKKEEVSSDIRDLLEGMQAEEERETDEQLKAAGERRVGVEVKIYYCKKCDETSIASPVRTFGFYD